MVVDYVEMVYGFAINLETFKKNAEVFEENTEVLESSDGSLTYFPVYNTERQIVLYNNTKLFFYHCCSELNQKFFIIGISLKIYYRKKTRCQDCEEHTVCDTCLGQTEHGFYDISSIQDNIVTLPEGNVCGNCKHDKRTQEKECPWCGHSKKFNSKFLKKQITKDMKNTGYDFSGKEKFKVFLLNDDCTSCD